MKRKIIQIVSINDRPMGLSDDGKIWGWQGSDGDYGLPWREVCYESEKLLTKEEIDEKLAERRNKQEGEADE